MVNYRRIGLFDSGLGGLAMAGRLRQALPQHDVICVADTAYMPYGSKSAAIIQKRSILACQTLLDCQCDALLVACNSAASVAGPLLQAHVPSHVLLADVIDLSISYLSRRFYGATLVLLATERTIRSGVYTHRLAPYHIKVRAVATPPWALMIEQGFLDGQVDLPMIAQYLRHAAVNSADAIVLGCTHYSLIKSIIERTCAAKVPVVDTAKLAVEAMVAQLLPSRQLYKDSAAESICMVSAQSSAFEQAARALFAPSARCVVWPRHLSL